MHTHIVLGQLNCLSFFRNPFAPVQCGGFRNLDENGEVDNAHDEQS